MIVESSLTYAGVRTRQLVVEGRGPVVVLLHGVFDSCETWRPLLERMHSAERRAVAVDLAGFGSADLLDPGPVLPQLSAFVTAVIEHHSGTSGVVLVGNSLGAFLTVQAATTPGLPIRAAVSVDSPGAHLTRLVRVAVRAGHHLSPLLPLIPATTRVARLSMIRAQVGRGLYAQSAAIEAEVLDRFLDQVSTGHGLARFAREGARILKELNESYHALAGNLHSPLLVLHGAKDPLIPVSTARELHARYSGSELHVLSHCGHCPQLDDPALVATLICEFAEKSRASGGYPGTQAI